jgi:hypothetical protein
MQDGKIEEFNREIEGLVAQMDALSQTPNNKITCEKLGDLKRVRDRLLTVMGQKSGYMLAKAEAELSQGAKAPPPPQQQAAAPAPAPQPPADPVSAGRTSPAAEPKPQTSAAAEKPRDIRPAAPEPVRPDYKPPQVAPKAAPERTAAVERAPLPPAIPERAPSGAGPQRNGPAVAAYDRGPDPRPGDAGAPTSLAPPPPGSVSQLPEPVEEGYSISDIREAGRGIFGTISAEFGGAINYAFQQYGQPNAYITGVEGGAAFLAGLRYGKGTLHRKTAPSMPIYWQGPSAGFDLGAEGSRALFLVYNLDDPYAIYGRFSGIGGSAYVAGGVGLNVLGKGGMVMVPIRSGLGLRLGANLAYLKFTERQTWNPF